MNYKIIKLEEYGSDLYEKRPFLINELIKDLSIQKEEAVFNAFKDCGFEKEFIEENLSAFGILIDYDSNSEIYFYLNRALFSVQMVPISNNGPKIIIGFF